MESALYRPWTLIGMRSRPSPMPVGWRAFETSRRRELLSWSHHAEVAALDPEDQNHLLDLAESEGWTVKQTRRKANSFKFQK
jgi:hypothetical protein